MQDASSTVLITEAEIANRVGQMARQISEDYRGGSLTVIGVLKGSFIFIADLTRQIDPAIDVNIEFMIVSSYGNRTTSSGQIRIERDIQTPLEGKDILLVEDIVDTGLTIEAVKDLLMSRKPQSMRIATLLEKQTAGGHPLTLDYVGFRIPDVFVVGYGLDFAQRYRNLKEIRILNVQ